MAAGEREVNIKQLNVIRGLCAFIVIVYHSKFVLWAGGNLYTSEIGLHTYFDYFLFGLDMLSSCGQQCVLAFFILSGFVIHHSYSVSNSNFLQFYFIRVVRIYYPYLVSMFLSIAVLWLLIKFNPNIAFKGERELNNRLFIAYDEMGWKEIVHGLFFTPLKEFPGLNSVYWSLKHEWIFYLIFPLYFYVKNHLRVIIFIGLAILYYFSESFILYCQMFFLIGMFVYDFCKNRTYSFKSSKMCYRIFLLILLVLFIALNLLVKLNYMYSADLLTVIMVVFAFFGILYLAPPAPKYLLRLADFSFSLYLIHMPVLLLCYSVFNRLLHKTIFFERYPYYVGIVVALIFGYFFFRIIEQPSLHFISRIKRNWDK